MANVIFYHLDVLASSREEINRIETRLKQPSTELVKWVARRGNQPEDEVATYLPELVGFDTVDNLSCMDESLNKAGRRFMKKFKRWTGIVSNHLLEVAEEYPKAIFLLEYFD